MAYEHMNKIKWITDSCSDLPVSLIEEMDIDVVELLVTYNQKTYQNDPYEKELKFKDFYQTLREKTVATTSLVSVGRFVERFEIYLKQGYDILYIGFSSALSGTYQSSHLAAEELKKQYPKQTIITIDSLSASMGLGLLIYDAYHHVPKLKSIEEITTYIEQRKFLLNHLFTVDDLGTLLRGGRLSYTSHILGTLLKVKPILHVSNEGRLVPVKKIRGRRKSLDTIVEMVVSQIEKPEIQTIFISHGDDIEDATYIKDRLSELTPVKRFICHFVGPVIGAHSGPNTIAVFFFGLKRMDQV